jgi:nucleoside-diphosphate-sugar epimerase
VPQLRISILGAAGFLGQNLAHRLVSEGHHVTGYVLNPSNADLGFESKSILSFLNSAPTSTPHFDVTINLAARRSTRNQPLTEVEVNKYTYEIPRQFIMRTARAQTIVLNASTYIQNFEGETGRTVDSYAAAKERLSKFLQKQSLISGFRTKDLFFFTIYGLGDRSNHLVPLLLEAARSGNRIQLSPGDQLMNLLYVNDATQNILNCISEQNELHYSKNYVWAEKYVTVKQLTSEIESVTSRKIHCEWGAREYAGHEMMNPWSIPMSQLTNFVAPTSLVEGISKIWESIQNEPS